jgi:16S rRNA processing protein RimM
MKRIIGNICGYHGIRGEIKIYPLVDNIDVFHSFKSLNINDKIYQVISVRFHKNLVLATLEGINNLNQAQELNGYVSSDLDEDLPDNEFYISDLIGLSVFDQENNEIGKVSNYSKIGQKLLYIKLFDNFHAKSELLVPFVEEYIISVKPSENKLQINLTEELLELCL